MDFDRLAQFLTDANEYGYANPEAKKAASTRPGSEDYHFEKDGLVYHDTYFGGNPFIGEEIVYENSKPVWGMNYFGFAVDALADEKEIYGFLRKALMQDSGDLIPVRGPEEYHEGEWHYVNDPKGNLDHFVGTEEIYKGDRDNTVYYANYHGGTIR